MTAIEWGAVGDRRFETGIDRGVLYIPGEPTTALPWDGLVSVTEDRKRDVKSYYSDGIKYLDRTVYGSYSAKLSAFTYPDALDALLGNETFAPGVYIHDQKTSYFNMTYRTREGDDIDGADADYKIHLLYNVIATPNDYTFETIGENISPKPFEWNLTGTPSTMFGIRPTSHISFSSRKMVPALLATIEEMLYGSEEEDPTLPDMVDLLALIEAAG